MHPPLTETAGGEITIQSGEVAQQMAEGGTRGIILRQGKILRLRHDRNEQPEREHPALQPCLETGPSFIIHDSGTLLSTGGRRRRRRVLEHRRQCRLLLDSERP